jgi:hypothetical protein
MESHTRALPYQFHAKQGCLCLTVSWTIVIAIILSMTLPVGLLADRMFRTQKPGEIGVNGRMVLECNATLKSEKRMCMCVCGRTSDCHTLEYVLSYSNATSNTTLTNKWKWGCHCSTYENVVIDGPMRCTMGKDNILKGYGREKAYKVMVITLISVFSCLTLVAGIVVTFFMWIFMSSPTYTTPLV